MTASLPAADPLVVAGAVDALPGRLRKRLDDMVARAAGWAVTVDGDVATVTVDEQTTVTLTPDRGVLRTAASARCSCLLAPNCLHRTAALVLCPPADEDAEGPFDGEPGAASDGAPVRPEPPFDGGLDLLPVGSGPTDHDSEVRSRGSRSGAPTDSEPDAPPGTATPGTGPAGHAGSDRTAPKKSTGATAPGSGAAKAGGRARGSGVDPALSGNWPAALSVRQRAAAHGLWQAGVGVLATGVVGSGVIAGVGLLRAAHEARAQGLHRGAAAGRRVAAGLRSAREAQPGFRLAALTDDLRELLGLAHALQGSEAPPELLGTARRAYDPRGSLRLYGLCTVPVVAESGYAGVLTYLVDRDGTLWAVADIYPGGVGRVAGSAESTVSVGEAAISYRALGRAGLILSGATATDTGQLGAGRSVRAVRAGGGAWADVPAARLWEQPLGAQVHRAFEALAAGVQAHPVGDDLLFLRVRVRGADTEGVWATTVDGVPLCLTAAAEYPELPYRHNLRILGEAVDGELLVVGSPDASRPGRVRALSVAVTGDGPPALVLPGEWAGRVDLGIDRLHRSHLPAPPGVGVPPGEAGKPAASDVPGGTGEAGGSGAPGGFADAAGSDAPGEVSEAGVEGASGVEDRPAAGEAPGVAVNLPVDGGSEAPGGVGKAAEGGVSGRAADAGGSGLPGGSADAAGSDVPGEVLEVSGEGASGVEDRPVAGDGPGVVADPPVDGGFRSGAAVDPALRFLRAQVERTVSGGRAVQALAADESRVLRRARLDTGAALMAAVGAAARHRPRDAFGRLADDDGHAYALAWLSAAVYEDAATRAFAEATWLPQEHGGATG
ncbi:hypothetical protein AB0M43_17890 [Longispora sp. NPDC051575]|uniref:hypothetical protein n=1 Tax=Longispora sp. NPDC051575 TaxID=3154943 RepID=UPI003414EB77